MSGGVSVANSAGRSKRAGTRSLRRSRLALPATAELLVTRHSPLATASKPPSLWLMALEMRALFEFGSSLAMLVSGNLQRESARGDGHPVLVLPGFVASDRSTMPLRTYLSNRGFDALGWGMGRNTGPHRRHRHSVIDDVVAKVHELHRTRGQRVSLVGWSLGGVFAREVAKRAPKSVRTVVTLGSPFAGPPTASNAWRLYQLLTGDRRHHFDAKLIESLAEPPPVPTTSIYSRTDGVVAWTSCVATPTPIMENVEVQASHFGLGVHPLVWIAIVDRLAQAEGAWRPFERSGWRAMAFPRSAA